MNMVKSNQQGRSMIEMLGVLAIIGVLSAGGIAGYSAAMESHKVNKFMEMVTFAVTKSTQIFNKAPKSGSVSYIGSLCNLQIVPYDICRTGSGNYRKGYFKDDINIQSLGATTGYSVKSSDGDTISIKPPTQMLFVFLSGKIAASACAKILSHQAWKQLGELSFTDGRYPISTLPATELPLPVSTASQMCTTDTNGFAVRIVLKSNGISI